MSHRFPLKLEGAVLLLALGGPASCILNPQGEDPGLNGDSAFNPVGSAPPTTASPGMTAGTTSPSVDVGVKGDGATPSSGTGDPVAPPAQPVSSATGPVSPGSATTPAAVSTPAASMDSEPAASDFPEPGSGAGGASVAPAPSAEVDSGIGGGANLGEGGAPDAGPAPDETADPDAGGADSGPPAARG